MNHRRRAGVTGAALNGDPLTDQSPVIVLLGADEPNAHVALARKLVEHLTGRSAYCWKNGTGVTEVGASEIPLPYTSRASAEAAGALPRTPAATPAGLPKRAPLDGRAPEHRPSDEAIATLRRVRDGLNRGI